VRPDSVSARAPPSHRSRAAAPRAPPGNGAGGIMFGCRTHPCEPPHRRQARGLLRLRRTRASAFLACAPWLR
jgi:hypothetical protein